MWTVDEAACIALSLPASLLWYVVGITVPKFEARQTAKTLITLAEAHELLLAELCPELVLIFSCSAGSVHFRTESKQKYECLRQLTACLVSACCHIDAVYMTRSPGRQLRHDKKSTLLCSWMEGWVECLITAGNVGRPRHKCEQTHSIIPFASSSTVAQRRDFLA